MFAALFAVFFSLLAPLRFEAATAAPQEPPPPPTTPGEDPSGAGKAQRPLRDGLYVGF